MKMKKLLQDVYKPQIKGFMTHRIEYGFTMFSLIGGCIVVWLCVSFGIAHTTMYGIADVDR